MSTGCSSLILALDSQELEETFPLLEFGSTTKAIDCVHEVSHGKWKNNTHTHTHKRPFWFTCCLALLWTKLFPVFLPLSSGLSQPAASSIYLKDSSDKGWQCSFLKKLMPTWLNTGSGGKVIFDLPLVLAFFSDLFVGASFYSFSYVYLCLAHQVIRKPGSIFPFKMY